MTPYTDFRLKFADLPSALAALDALRQAGLLGDGELPANMLGDPVLDAAGDVIARARRGVAASTYTDPVTGQPATIPARGDPAFWYAHIRTEAVLPDGFDPAAFGLTMADPAECAAVLGVWA